MDPVRRKALILAPSESSPAASTSSNTSTVPNSKVQNMTAYINSRVGIFDPASKSVSVFLSELKTAHDLYVVGDKTWGAKLEDDFFLQLKAV